MWGSLLKIGLPLFVLEPATAQLLLPFAGLGLNSSVNQVESVLCRYTESIFTGSEGKYPGMANGVPLGTIGARESAISGKSNLKFSSPST